MSVARSNFLERFSTLAVTLLEPYVQDGALHESERNAKARLIRNGLAVIGFSYLEDFIRQRTSEVLASISASAVPFPLLPSKIQEASTFGLLRALQNRISLLSDPATKILFAQMQARSLASTLASPYELSELAFGYKGSNIATDEVGDMLRAFKIETPWQSVALLASKVGLSSLPLENCFTIAAKRRHSAAHVAGAVTPHGDLMAYINEAKAIAFGYDSLISSALVRIKRRDASYYGGSLLTGTSVQVTLVLESGGRFKEKVWGSRRARATSPTLSALETVAIPRADASGSVLAFLDQAGQLRSWQFPSAV